MERPETDPDLLQITLSSPDKFKGFLVVVQDKDEKDGGTTIGKFKPGE